MAQGRNHRYGARHNQPLPLTGIETQQALHTSRGFRVTINHFPSRGLKRIINYLFITLQASQS
ncbi:hypothetical protein, partial [Adonisia turfae]|uniref:hypothetical protein n=1 Tax=Adonisia turfae TaxID=2950184 RepID=UPI002029A361